MLRRFADPLLRRELDRTRDARDQARDTARRLHRRLQAARAAEATHKALAGRWRSIAQGAQTELAEARAELAALNQETPK